MKKLTPFIALIVLLSSMVAISQEANAAAQPRKVLSGWIPYYSMNRSLPAVVANADIIREVMPFWYTLKFNGAKKLPVVTDLYAPANPSVPIAIPLATMRNSGFTIIPTITDGTSELVLAKLLANPTSRTQVVNAITDLVMTNNYDGIDLDFEGFAFVDKNTTWNSTKPNWIAFVKELSGVLKSKNKLLSVSTPYMYDPAGAQKGYFVYAWADVASSIDRLRIMTYDYSVAKPGPIGPLSWTEKTVKYAVSIMSPSKVYIGLPGYGRDWITSVNGKCPVSAPPGLKGGAKAAVFKMNYANAKAVIDKATPVFDEKFSEATYSYTQTYNGLSATGASTECRVNRTVWYQNARSYAERMALVAKYRLGGASLWTLAMEDPAATTELRNAALAIAPDPVVSTLSIEGAPQNTINYAGLFTVKGLLTLKDKTPIAGLTVSLEIKRANESSWSKVTELVTGVDGTISTPMTLGADASLRLTTVGTWEQAESVSSEFMIKVKSTIQLDRPVSVSKGAPIVIKAQLLPRLVGKSAQLQKNINGKWQNVGAAVISDANGLFTFTTAEAKRGVVTMRVQLLGDIASEQFAIVIR